jgi:hypothetical protein
MHIIYDHPRDYPDHFVVRRWFIDFKGVSAERRPLCVCETLEQARKSIPMGCVCFKRNAGDDPVIVETWM